MAKKKKTYNFEQVVINKDGVVSPYEGSRQQALDNNYQAMQSVKQSVISNSPIQQRTVKQTVKPTIKVNTNENTLQNDAISNIQKNASEKETQSRKKTTTNTIQTPKGYENTQEVVDNLKIAKKNLKEKEQTYNNALLLREKKLSDELNNQGYQFNNRFEDRSKKNISYLTKNEDNKRPFAEDLENQQKFGKALQNTENSIETKNANTAFNDLLYAQYQKDIAQVNSEDTNLFDKTLGVPIRAAKDLVSVLGNNNKYIDEKGNKYFLPDYNQIKQEKVSGDYNSKIGKFIGDVVYNTTKIGGAALVDAFTAGLGGKALYWSDMAADNYKNVINQGYTKEQAIANTIISTGTEALTEKLLGGVSKTLTGGKMSGLQSGIANGVNKLISNPKVANIIGSMASEGAEEFVQEYIDNLNRLITLENSTNAKDYLEIFTDQDILEQALYSAGVGALSGATMTGINNYEGEQVYKNTQMYESIKTALQNKIETLDNVEEKEKYEKAIEMIDDYLEKPFNNDTAIDTNEEIQNNQIEQEVENNDITNSASNLNLGKYNTTETKTSVDNYIDNYNQNLKEQKTQEQLDSLNKQVDKLQKSENKIIENFKKSSDKIDRNSVLDYSNVLNIPIKKGSSIIENTNMSKLSGRNKKPSIIDIGNPIIEVNNKNRKQIRKSILESFIRRFNNKEIMIYDTNTTAMVGKKGIEKTLSGAITTEKVKSMDKLDNIVANGIYKYTTADTNDANGILYHHFITPVRYKGSNEVIRTIIKEYTKNPKLKDKYYYHQMELLDKKKTEDSTLYRSKSEYKAQEPSVSKNNISKNNKNVKSDISTNSNMQQKQKDTQKTTIKEKNNSDILYENKDTGDVLVIKNNVKNKPLTKKTTSDEINYVLNGNKNESKFFKNITENSKFITEENRNKLSKENIKYYDKVTNKESLAEAQERLDNMGENAIVDFFSDKKNVDSVDIATGWILLKRFQDIGDYDSMVEVAKKMRSMGTKSGQAVQAFNIMQRLTPEGMVKYAQSELMEAYDKYSKNKSKKWIDENRKDFGLTPEETQFIVDTMKKVETMEDGYPKKVELAKIQKMLQDKLPPEKGQGVKSWMRISMLFNPKTQIRNIVGNAAITPVNAAADVFSATADKILAKKTGVRTTGMANIGAYLKGSKQGAYEATNDFKLGINTKDVNQNRFEVGQGKAFNEKMKGVKSIFNPISKVGNKVDHILNYALDVGDRVFSQGAFNQSLQNQMILNNATEITQDMIDIAEQEALSRTWNDDNNYTKFVLDVRRGLNKIGPKSYGLGDILIPFAKTPANLTKAIVDYSPVGIVNTLLDFKNVKNNIETGTLTPQMQHEFVQKLGKATAGTMLYILGTALAKAKITSGGNDDDKEVSDFMRNTLGIQPYSIKIGNKSFTYDWMQPVAAPFAIAADLEKKKDEKQSLHDAISSVADTGFNLLMEQSFMQSINDVLSGYGSKFEKIEEQVYGLPARSVPTFLKQINDMIDDKTRMIYEKNSKLQSGINQAKAKTPGLSNDLPVKRDTLGRKIKKYGGDNNAFNVFINPANIQKGKVSESAKEIYKIYEKTKDNRIMPRQPASQLRLNNKETSEFLKISGTIVNDNVKELKYNEYYQNMSDEDKADVIKGIVDYAYNKAKAKVTGSPISRNWKTADEIISDGVPIYDYYANKKEDRYYYRRKENKK